VNARRFGTFALLATLFAGRAAHAQSAPPGEPPSGSLDADDAQALAEAERAVEARLPDRAFQLVMPIFAAPNRFTLGAQAVIVPRAAAVMRKVGEQSTASGKVELGLQAYDAAWHMDHRVDAAYAAALVARAENERSSDPDAALWLVRRARTVAPSDDSARRRDEQWSSNRLAPYGYALLVTGLLALAGGIGSMVISANSRSELTGGPHDRARTDELLSRQTTFAWTGAFAFAVSGVSYLTGIGLIMGGNPTGAPRSPAYLPALKDASR